MFRSTTLGFALSIGLSAGMLLPDLAVCSNPGQPIISGQKDAQLPNGRDPRLVSANTKFGFKLYEEIIRRSGDTNIFVSPLSVGLALAMAYFGAEGETRQAMARTLELQAMSLEDVHRAYSQLQGLLSNPSPNVQLQIANSLWGRKGVKFNPNFIGRTKQFFDGQVSELDFDDPSTRDTINQWVSEKTNGKIGKTVDRIDPNSVLLLVNAIYFKGIWSKKFDKTKTKNETFYLADGKQKPHPMMTQSGAYKYYESENFQAISLPYGDERMSLYIFLPAKNAGLQQFNESLTAANWENWMNQFSMRPGSITLPRFRMGYEVSLNEQLKALGMGVAFERNHATFAEMSEFGKDLFISEVKHKTFVEVNEEGTEAAAATSARATMKKHPREPFRMVVDRPFFCAIRDNQTGTILFLGSIAEPL